MKISGLMKLTLLDYPEKVACTVFTEGCNFRCPFCHNSDLALSNASEEYTEDQIINFLKMRSGVLEGVAITGGEPTLHKDLPDFISRIKSETGMKVKLDTNGSNPSMLRELLETKITLEDLSEVNILDYVAMDVKSGYTNYPKVCGVDVDFPKVEESMDILMRSDIDFEFRTTVVDGLHTEKDFYEINDMIKDYKFIYYLQKYKDGDNILDKDNNFKTPDNKELEKYASILKRENHKVKIRG